MPLLWNIVHIVTFDELKRFHETLKVTPSIAQHVRTFCFMMVSMDPLCDKCVYNESTTLHIAAMNPIAMSLQRRGLKGDADHVMRMPGQEPCDECPPRLRPWTGAESDEADVLQRVMRSHSKSALTVSSSSKSWTRDSSRLSIS